MKQIVITLSIVANAVLALIFVSPATFNRIVPFANVGTKAGAGQDLGAYGSRNRNGRTSLAPGSDTTTSYASLQALPPAELVARLRAAGLPENVIRAMLTAQLNIAVTERRIQMAAERPELPYWKSPNMGPTLTPAQQSELRQLSRQNQALVIQLLGPTNSVGMGSAYESFQFGSLPSDKIAQIQLINSDYADISAQVRGAGGSILLPEEREQLAFLEKEKEKDLQALLSPEEYEDYIFRTSSSGNTLRNNLQFFEPTEAEFRTLFALQRAYDLQYTSTSGPMDPTLSRARAQASQQLALDKKAAIDPARLADYERTTDNSYIQIGRLAAQIDLPKQSIATVWSLQKELQAQATSIRTNNSLSAEARIERLTELKTDATNRMTGALGGQKNLDAYKNNVGNWIDSLVPAAPPTGSAVERPEGMRLPIF